MVDALRCRGTVVDALRCRGTVVDARVCVRIYAHRALPFLPTNVPAYAINFRCCYLTLQSKVE